ncbi:MAG: dihydrolipoamide acetyltransferase family protein [Steroidobacteraceae bacterium]|jgi:pyruvate dehydrogenase E2 component (dihydrolipoamide acetyltransferase)
MTVFKLPDLGEGLSEAEILRWHVQVGDHIEVDAPMLSVETAKAVVEVPSPVSGTIVALHASPGDRIEIGAPLIEFSLDGAAAGGAPPQADDAGTVVGHMPAPQQVPDIPTSAGARGAAAPAAPRVRAAPAARALARSLGIDLDSLTGSGRDGLIMLDDVLAAGTPARTRAQAAPAAASPSRAAPRLQGQLEALRSLRRTMAQTMSLARDNIMACTVFDDADLHRWARASDYTLRVLRAIASAVRAEPALNAWYDAAAQTRTLFQHLDVGVAVDTPDGLLMPVIRHVDKLDAAQLRAELERLKRAARERTLKTDELRDFTFMLSNFGTMAGRYATPVIVPPAIAILGTGRVRQDVLAVDNRVEIHARMPLSLTFDHRVVTGGEAVRFLGALMADLEREE